MRADICGFYQGDDVARDEQTMFRITSGRTDNRRREKATQKCRRWEESQVTTANDQKRDRVMEEEEE